MANKQRMTGMLGFAMRAGKLVFGTDLILSAVAKNKVKLVVASSGASASTKEKLKKKSDFYGVRYIEIEMSPSELGALFGKVYTPASVAVTDEGFAKEIVKAYEDTDAISNL